MSTTPQPPAPPKCRLWKISNYRPPAILARDPNESTYATGDDKFLPLTPAKIVAEHNSLVAHGTRPYGEKSGTVKIREADAISIIVRVEAGEPMSRIAKEFKLSKTHVRDIASGKKWKHLERKFA